MAYRTGALRRLEITVRGAVTEQRVLEDGFPGPDSLPVCRRV